MAEAAPGFREAWGLEPGLAFLNHGSFGACPTEVLAEQQGLRDELERQPVEFFVRAFEARLDAAREKLAAFVGARPENLVPVTNATTGVNTVLRSLAFSSGDELLVTDHAYNACRNALSYVAERWGAKVVVVKIPIPVAGPQQVIGLVQEAVTGKTKLALLDHVTSPTGLVLPIRELVRRLRERGVETLVDGAHGPGMVDLDLEGLGAAYYTGNCHKWICAPKGAGFLYVRPDLQPGIVPLVISHGANMPRPGRSRFHDLFDWVGTDDPTAFLCVPKALACLAGLVPGGWPEVRRRNREKALRAREILCGTLGQAAAGPPEMIGSLAAVSLPPGEGPPPTSALYQDPLQERLLKRYHIEVPIVPWPAPPARLVRVSAQLYNHEDEYRRLADALKEIL